jgi:hypothetical protein
MGHLGERRGQLGGHVGDRRGYLGDKVGITKVALLLGRDPDIWRIVSET